METLKQYLAKKAVLIVLLLCTIAVLLGINDIQTNTGYKAVIGNDTCTVQYKNFWTGNYRVTGKQGEFSVNPAEITLLERP